MSKENILIIPDIHIPAHHQDTLLFLRYVRNKFNTTLTVCTGDLVDQYGLSNFDQDPDADGQNKEYKNTMEFLRELYKEFPEMLICYGNHDLRHERKAAKSKISKRYIKSLPEVLECPEGWIWADYHDVNGFRFQHGMGFTGRSAALNAALTNGKSTIIGHTHTNGGVSYSTTASGTIFGMNVGSLVDENHIAFAYSKYMRNKNTLGSGVIIDQVPIFVPMLTDENGRWIKHKEIEQATVFCNCCKQTKQASEFSIVRVHGKEYYQTQCRSCLNKKARDKRGLK